jgi:U6 snRNA phosphodiesterase
VISLTRNSGHATTAQHAVLVSMLEAVQSILGKTFQLNGFLISDLGSPLPLHISLSRPIVLTSTEKDQFLAKITNSLATSAIAPFALRPHGLAWYKSPDSDRTFLVLKVSSAVDRAKSSTASGADGESDSDVGDSHDTGKRLLVPRNKALAALLTRCNSVVTSFGQPALYQRDANELVEEAFHVSIAWGFALPSEELCLKTSALLESPSFRRVRKWDLSVSSVKAKIGNVVTHIALPTRGTNGDWRNGQQDLFLD